MKIEFEVAETLKQIALDEEIKTYVLQHPSLYQSLLQAALRFIGAAVLILKGKEKVFSCTDREQRREKNL
jgi:hypothetical protein